MPKIKAFPHTGPNGEPWGMVFDLNGAGGHKFLAVLPEGAQAAGQYNSKYFETEQGCRDWLDKIMRRESNPEPSDA